MTKYDAEWVAREEAKRAYMAEHGLYSEHEEHSSCGVGLVVSIDGSKSRAVVENGIKALKAIWHRGAVDADGKTGDGAGIHVEIPAPFFYDQVRRTGHQPKTDLMMAVGQVFLPRTDFGAQEMIGTGRAHRRQRLCPHGRAPRQGGVTAAGHGPSAQALTRRLIGQRW